MVEVGRSLNWRVLCDWDYNNQFSDPWDDISARIDIARGISATRGRDPSRSLGEPRVPALQMVGLNDDRFFTNGYSGSPIYQKATTGRPVELAALVGEDYDANAAIDADSQVYADGTDEVPVYSGFLDRLTHQPAYQDRRVDIRALGSFVRLKNHAVISTTAVYSNITTGQAMGYLLDAVGWPATKRRIEGAAVVLKQWWLNKENPYAAAVQLLRTEGPGAYVGEDADGTIVFEGQDYRTGAARSLTPQATFSPSTGFLFQDPQHEDGADAIINLATYHVTERALAASAAVWSYSPQIVLSASQTRFIEFTLDDPFTALVSPLVSGTDYTLSAGSLTQATVLQQTANRATVTLIAGAGGATLTGLQVRGQSYAVVNEADVQNSVSTTGSQLTHGVSSRDVSGRAEIDRNVAIAICDTTVQRYQDPRAVNRFTLPGVSGLSIQQAITRRVSDRVHYTELQTGQDHDGWIESIEWRAIDGLLVAVFGVERTIAQGYGRYDSGAYDTAVYGQ